MLDALREVYRYRELLIELAYRDIRVRYKQTFLGAAWAICLPVFMMVVFTQVFASTGRNAAPDLPYPVFLYCGLLPWQFFASCLKGAVESLTKNRLLVTKIYLPREVFPFAQILSSGVDFLVASLVLGALMIWYRIPLSPTILMVPLILTIQIALTTGLSLLLSMGHLFYRDVKYVFEVVLLLWMFATSVIYDIPTHGDWSSWLALNPMTPIIDAYRQTILLSELPSPLGLCYAALLAALVFWVGVQSFHQTEYLFAEKI